jgi:hypothetical protein
MAGVSLLGALLQVVIAFFYVEKAERDAQYALSNTAGLHF